MAAIYTLCIPFLDVIINSPWLVQEIGISPNEMTQYRHLSPEKKQVLQKVLDENTDVHIAYGGMSYNTAVRVAALGRGVRSVFIGPFAKDEVSNRVFKAGSTQAPEKSPVLVKMDVEGGPSTCFVIVNGSNRAMISRPSSLQKITAEMVDRLHEEVCSEGSDQAVLVYLCGYTVEKHDLSRILEEKKSGRLKALLCFNLADPGVLQRSYAKIREFVRYSDWVIGNRKEFDELYDRMRGEEEDRAHPKGKAVAKEKEKAGTSPDQIEYLSRRIRNMAITDGPYKTTVVCVHNGKICRESQVPEQIPAINTAGAGDAFAASLLCGVLQGQKPADMLSQALAETAEYLRNRKPPSVFRIDSGPPKE